MATASPPLSPTSTHAPKWRVRSSRSYTREQLEQHFGNPQEGTLTTSVDDPQRISRIVISESRQPSFPPEILIKSNLHFVFNTPLRTLQTVPVPVFRQVPWEFICPPSPGGTQKPQFEFSGWYSIENVRCLERHSPELCSRLEAKWEAKRGHKGQCTPESWGRSLDSDWALITLRFVTERGCPLEQPSPPSRMVDEDMGGGVGINPGGFGGRRAFSIDDGPPEDYLPGPPPPTRRTTNAGLASSMGPQVDEYFIPPPPPPPTRVTTTLGTPNGSTANSNMGGSGSGLDCKLMDESIINISKQSEEDMSDSEYGNVTRSEIEDCDRWSELSTGPVDRQWTVVYEEKDEVV